MSTSGRHIIAWLMRALLAAAFISSGFHKLSDLPGTSKMFGGLGLPGWFAYLIGGAELLGLIIIMLAALFMHANGIPGGLAKGVPALAMLVLLVIAPGQPGAPRMAWPHYQ